MVLMYRVAVNVSDGTFVLTLIAPITTAVDEILILIFFFFFFSFFREMSLDISCESFVKSFSSEK